MVVLATQNGPEAGPLRRARRHLDWSGARWERHACIWLEDESCELVLPVYYIVSSNKHVSLRIGTMDSGGGLGVGYTLPVPVPPIQLLSCLNFVVLRNNQLDVV